jgi:monoamine oxidase
MRTTRRELLRTAAGATAGLAAAPLLGCGSGQGHQPRIVIVGAGLAGLACAHRLRKAGHLAEVHEASERLGGRVWTIRDYFAEGQIAEHGGELIDSEHTAIRGIVSELGLELDNVIAAEKLGTRDIYWIDGAQYPLAQARADYEAIRPALRRDLRAAGYPTFHDRHTTAGVALDRMSVTDWIQRNVPGGVDSRLGRLLAIAYTIEFGAQCTDQSALNLLYLLGYSRPHRLQLFGTSNERFHVQGGNDLMVSGLAKRLRGQIRRGSRLVSIRRRASGGYFLAFDRRGGGTATVAADQVVLAIPFTVLRSSVDYSRAGFSRLKGEAIEELGMGSNSKLQLQFSDRHWRALGANGGTYSDTGYQSTWEVTRAQPGRAGILVDYTGGRVGRHADAGSVRSAARRFLAQIDPVIGGLGGRWNGRVTLNDWSDDDLTLGSYAYYRVGQMTRFGGVERKPSGACHFAGEQTAYTFQGYMEGAVRSGQRAAGEIIETLR